jgi:glutamyl-tRNA synthetase
LALLGWSPGDDVENITMEELVQLFTVERVNSSPARFDMKKLEAINGDKIRALTIDDFLSRALPFLLKDGVIQGSDEEIAIVKSALPIIQERIARMNEVTAMLKFLFVEEVIFDSESETKVKEEPSQHVISQALSALENVNDWKHDVIESALRAVLIEKLGLKPRLAFGPVRIAVTGSHISPPLFESMELLGKARSLARLKAAVH